MASWAQSDVEVSIPYGDAVLAGTLTLPQSPARAAVVLIQGAGPHGRNQIISGTPMFKELAWRIYFENQVNDDPASTAKMDWASYTASLNAAALEPISQAHLAILDQALAKLGIT